MDDNYVRATIILRRPGRQLRSWTLRMMWNSASRTCDPWGADRRHGHSLAQRSLRLSRSNHPGDEVRSGDDALAVQLRRTGRPKSRETRRQIDPRTVHRSKKSRQRTAHIGSTWPAVGLAKRLTSQGSDKPSARPAAGYVVATVLRRRGSGFLMRNRFFRSRHDQRDYQRIHLQSFRCFHGQRRRRLPAAPEAGYGRWGDTRSVTVQSGASWGWERMEFRAW